MSDYYQTQLDFIFFLYGLTFILLGALCFVVARSRPAGAPTVRMIGLFAFVRGLAEWMAMAALVTGDTPVFAELRVVVIVVSLMLLTEAARRGAIRFGYRVPGLWIYPVGAVVLLLVGYGAGIATADVLARYSFGLVGAFGTSATMFAGRNDYNRAIRPIKIGVAAGFAVYGLATGLIVPPAPFWPANVVNEAWFVQLTGVPIQIVRGSIAVVLSLVASVAWGSLLIQSVDSPLYSTYLKRQALATFGALALIVLLGGILTQSIGGIFRDNIENEATGETDVLVGRVSRETATVDAMVEVLAGMPQVVADVEGGIATRLQALLDLNVRASVASLASIYDKAGNLLASSERRQLEPLGALNRQAETWFIDAMRGENAHDFQIDPTGARTYLTAYPVRAANDTIIGVATLETSLESLATHLRGFDHPFFIVDARGIILLSNRRQDLQRSLWPQRDLAPQSLSEQFGEPKRPAIVTHPIVGSEWTSIDGRPGYAMRKAIGRTGLSLVLTMPMNAVFAGRLLGIIITLQLAIAVLVYFMGRERSVRDRILRVRRGKLQNRARYLAHKAATDALTGVANRMRFNERLAEEMARSRRTAAPFSLLLFDVDRFKTINDSWGHPCGDQVLVQLARTVAANVRQTDLLARWGGEEFAILLIHTNLLDAAEVAEKLRRLIERTPFDQAGTVTSSFGVAEFLAQDSAESMFSRADHALYRAKLNGRNRVEFDPPEVESAPLAPALTVR
jgi:diguanylate cyclase (GGDEF)-like protein